MSMFCIFLNVDTIGRYNHCESKEQNQTRLIDSTPSSDFHFAIYFFTTLLKFDHSMLMLTRLDCFFCSLKEQLFENNFYLTKLGHLSRK